MCNIIIAFALIKYIYMSNTEGTYISVCINAFMLISVVID